MRYEEAIQKVKDGERFSVDFKERVLKINGKPVNVEDDESIKIPDINDWLDKLEELYDNYKYSRPSASDGKSKFYALSPDELVLQCGHDGLNNPIEREEARAELEIFILFSLVNGSFDVDKLFEKDWFFQGLDKSLIMFKNWF